jgi:putative transcriptional regulator
MSEENMIRARLLPDGTVVQVLPDGSTRPMVDTTDYARLNAMSEDEIEANALSDPDNPPLTDEELKRFHRIQSPKEIRQKLQMTQEQFAAEFRIPLGTLRDWEQGVSSPDTAARSYLRVIAKNPQAVLDALN